MNTYMTSLDKIADTIYYATPKDDISHFVVTLDFRPNNPWFHECAQFKNDKISKS